MNSDGGLICEILVVGDYAGDQSKGHKKVSVTDVASKEFF